MTHCSFQYPGIMNLCWAVVLFRAGLSCFFFQIAAFFVLGCSPAQWYRWWYDFTSDFSVFSRQSLNYPFIWTLWFFCVETLRYREQSSPHIFLWLPLLIASHFSQDVIPSTCTFFQTWPDTDTAVDFLIVKTSHPHPGHEVHKHIQ